MTAGRCQRRKKMMGRGAEGGCGTEEKTCPVSRFPARVPATQPEIPEQPSSSYLDYYAQARKALCERSPFDEAEGTSASAVLTLPTGLASFLSRHAESRKRHKKTHSGADKVSSGERPRTSNFWVEAEEYFRDLTFTDINSLYEVSSLSSLAARKCFLIPSSGNARRLKAVGSENVNGGDATRLVVKEEDNEDQMNMEIDNGKTDGLSEEVKARSLLNFTHGLEWLLGCRNKVSLTSERPSKKRKLLGEDAGLEKLLIACPCEGSSILCHVCSMDARDKKINRLIVCSSCKVAIHRKCYGWQEDIDLSWQCTWCRQKADSSDAVNPCVLCPKSGGALKPVHKIGENGGSVDFAHLFCCLWMPEVYMEDLNEMEPIRNVEGINETRRKLLCNICKVKLGYCLRCSHGTCRTSFHPICAREAGQRMEVWGKYGCDNVELRAFCSKHSALDISSDQQLGDLSEPVLSNSHVVNHLPVTLSINRPQKLVVGRRNGDSILASMDSLDTSDISGDSELLDTGLTTSRSNVGFISEDSDAQHSTILGSMEKEVHDVNLSDSLKFAPILKKLIDRGKVNVNDVASEIGISPEALVAKLDGDNLVPDVGCKILKWLKCHAYMGGALEKSMRLNRKSAILSMAGVGAIDGSDTLPIPESDSRDSVAVKSVPPRRRTKSNIRILKEKSSDKGIIMDRVNQHAGEDPEDLSKEFVQDEKLLREDSRQDSVSRISPKCEGISVKPSDYGLSEEIRVQEAIAGPNSLLNAHEENLLCSVANPARTDQLEAGAFRIHPYIHDKLLQVQSGILVKKTVLDSAGSTEGEICHLEASSNNSVSCNDQNQNSNADELSSKSDKSNEQLIKARRMGVQEFSPKDEVEGEIVYFQQKLLGNVVARKQFTEKLIYNVAKSLPKDIDASRSRKWDAVLVNQYLYGLREAKKQGKKERKHKEAQAVLAAATAAAAASSRTSSFRKDVFEESAHQELFPRAKDSLSKDALPKISFEKQSVSEFSKEHPRACDICRRPETILKPILVCSSCKVAVHLDCYRSVKESSGPWYCELCEHISASRNSGAPTINSWEKSSFVAECGLCGGSTGAFRKSSDGQWIHAFCAEWVFESTFRRGQAKPVEGMESVSKGVDVCIICRQKHGVCIKCNYGHCQSTFHPSCARSAGLFMSIKASGGRLHHKAYCEKHSSEQRAKAENQTFGIEELKQVKQIRVELERLRLLCERIVKREKIKRELVFCSNDLLAFKRDFLAHSLLVRSPFIHHEVSTESATTSVKGLTGDFKSCSEAIQRSDDTTVDSTISVKDWTKVPRPIETDQKTDDDSSISQNQLSRTLKQRQRPQFSGKQIPHRPSVTSHNPVDGGHRLKSRKNAETFQKELLMTSDQASMKNSLLPKRYLYVPADILSKDKLTSHDTGSGKPAEFDE